MEIKKYKNDIINKSNFLLSKFFLIVFLLLFSLFSYNSLAKDDKDKDDKKEEENIEENLDEETKKEIEEKEDEIEKIDKKKKAYKKIVKVKQEQQETLENQINFLEKESEKLSDEIKENIAELEKLSENIQEIKKKIEIKEKVIAMQKEFLSGLIQSYYESRQENVLTAFVSGNGLHWFFNKEERVVQVGDKIKETLDNVESVKADMESEKEDLDTEQESLEELTDTLKENKESLENRENQKKGLLEKTKGEEAKYQDMIKKLEQQKEQLLGDIDELFNANSAEINSILADLKKPKSGLASRSWYYSQKDPRWGSDKIGQSRSLMKDYGCAISSVAMVFTHHGERVNPKKLARLPIYYWDLIKWPANWPISQNKINLIKNTQHNGVNWNEIDKEIEKKNPVIVFVKARGSAGHYVVIHGKDKKGKYVIHDPYFGPNIYLDSTFKLLSKLYNRSISKNSVDQMILYKK